MKLKILLFTILICSLSSCQEDWLEEKRSISMVVPQTLNDMRMILNNNRLFYIEGTFYADASADNYYITESIYNALDQSSRNHYTWGADLYEGRTTVTDWNKSYEQVLNANIILEGLEQIEVGDQFRIEYNDIKGGALYFRSKAFLNLAMQYAPAFNANEAQSLMGIPLRLSSDIHTPVIRATLEETYKRITEDLSLAASLLADVPEHPTDASKAAAYGLLARCYLYMGDYANALSSAENSLQLYSELLDYNTINPENNFPFQNFNKEVLIYGIHQGLNPLAVDTRAKIVPELYDMYDENDLRKQLFFRENTDGTFAYRGSYTESRGPFNGVTVSEIFLIKAECEARLSQTDASMTTLNHLLERTLAVEKE